MNIKQKVIDGVVFDISDTGYVYRNDYIDTQGRCIKGKEIIPIQNTSGYLHFVFGKKINGKPVRHMYFIHRLIAELFVDNSNPDKYNIVDHIDGNKLNNSPTNLRWTDIKGNINNPNTKYKSIEGIRRYYSNPENRDYIANKTREAMQRPDVINKMRRPRSEEAKQKMAMKGRVWINNGKENKFVKQSELQYYINNGYVQGNTFSKEIGKKSKHDNTKGMIWINNGVKNKVINPDELNKYIEQGYKKGQIKHGQ